MPVRDFHKPLVVRVVPYRTLKTCLLLRDSHCEGELFQDLDIHVRIERVHCWVPPPLKQIWNGCCYEPCGEPERCPWPVIFYRAFERDSEGRICFYWDKLLYEQKPGRYSALVQRGNDTLCAFGIQLEAAPLVVEQVVNVEAQPDCETGDCGG